MKAIRMIFYPILLLVSLVFRVIVNIRNNRFDRGKIRIYKTHKPVISIGNLSVGGSGKTPLTILICKMIMDMGYKPAVAGRGYKKPESNTEQYSVYKNWREFGDELYLIHNKLNIPVFADRLKYKACLEADKSDSDIIIIDDGYQHRYIHRDLNCLIIDEKTLEQSSLIPAGILREPLNEIKRADIVFIYSGIETGKIDNLINNKAIVEIRRKSGEIYHLTNKPIVFNPDKKAVALSGIANPERFTSNLKDKKINIESLIVFPDHHNYDRSDVDKIIQTTKAYSIDTIITTEKDAVKLSEFADILEANRIDCFVLPIEIEITKGRELLQNQIYNILKNRG